MFDFLMISGSMAHVCALMLLVLAACWHWRLPQKDWPFVVLLLFWTTLVFTGHVASLTHTLNSLSSYVLFSFPAVALSLFVFSLSHKMPATQPLMPPIKLDLDSPQNPKVRRFLFWFLGGTFVLFTVFSLCLAMGVYPDNADSIIYRLPRAFWYVSSGSFLHPFDVIDKRLVYYPLNGVSLYVPLVLYGLPGTFHAIPSLFAWGMVVYTSYLFARELGADKLLSGFAAWLVALTPSILAQAISTNDEILAAASFLCCLYMFYRWLTTGRSFYFLLSSISVALSAGTKLHIVFLMPIIGLLLIFLLMHLYKDRGLGARILSSIDRRTMVLSVVMVAVLFTPFLFYNYASVGRMYFFDDFKKEVFNLSAHMQVGFQNIVIYFSQMMFSPIADMNFWPDTPTREVFNAKLNEVFNPLIRPLIDNNREFFHLNYRFVGVTIPVSVKFVEFSLWSAFIWLLWPLQALLAMKQKTAMRYVFLVVAMTPLIWIVSWSFLTLYMEGTATYFTFYLICAAPASVLIFGKIRNNFRRELRWLLVGFVVITNIIICHNLVMYSGFRAIPDLFYAKGLPYDWIHTKKPVIDEIRRAKRMRIVFTHDKMPYFAYMHWNPTAEYLSPYKPESGEDIYEKQQILNLLPVSSLNQYGYMPVKVPGKLDVGATFLGVVRAIGPEAIFAIGNGVETRHPDESDYLIFRANIMPRKNKKGLHFSIGQNLVGFSPHDRLLFEYKITQGDRVIYHRPAKKNPVYEVDILPLMSLRAFKMTIIISSSWSLKEITRMTYALGASGAWLQDLGEY